MEPVINQVSPSSPDDLLPTSDGTISTSLAAEFLEPDLFVPSNVHAAPIPPDHVLHPETSLSTSNLTLNTPEVAINEEKSAAVEADVQIRCEMIKTSRKKALDAIEDQAHKMVKRSNVQLSDANHGDNVAILVPAVDKGKCDPRNIIGVVLGKTPENNYKIGVKSGILKGTYMRNAFAVCPRKCIAPDDVLTKSVSIREATKLLPGGGQGIFHCDCKQSGTQCFSRRCKC